MKRRSISKKPSQTHIIWTPDPSKGVKRFHEEHLQKWCQHFGFDFERYRRVDHDRGEQSRKQYQCIFSYEQGRKAVEIGGKKMIVQTDEMPKTFMEIDDEGVVRLQGFSKAKILNVTELWHKGKYLFFKATNRDSGLKIDVSNLVRS